MVLFSICAMELRLDVQQFISFTATPGMSKIRSVPPGMVCSKEGCSSVPPHLEVCCKQLAEMTEMNAEREIFNREAYLREYVGGSPINVIGLRLKFDGKEAFVQDCIPHKEDSRVLDVASFPLISVIYPTSIQDASHALADKASWGFLLTYKLGTMIGKEGLRNGSGTVKWQELLVLVHSAADRLSFPAPGIHFFFVGEVGARRTASNVAKLLA